MVAIFLRKIRAAEHFLFVKKCFKAENDYSMDISIKGDYMEIVHDKLFIAQKKG